MSRRTALRSKGKQWVLVAAVGGLLAACGGGSAPSDMGNTKSEWAAGSTLSEPSRSADPAALKRSAALNTADLAAAEQQAQDAEASASFLDELQAGAIAAKRDYQSGAVARKALAMRIPVYRFFNGGTGAHFFTTSTTERDNVVNTLSPPFSLEGEAFSVASDYSPGLSLVHRFYNTQTGVHFYTISETERANVVANLPQFSYEGVAYHASQVGGAGLIPFFRFYVPSKGFHFYTAEESEKESIIANLAATYTYEGIGYYVLASDWRAEKLPHTGINSDQCFHAGSDTLVGCGKPETSDLNPQQDGHRAAINTMSFSTVGGHALTTCVQDNITGLIWEGKEASGMRAGRSTYTHLGNGMTNDVSGYVLAMNTARLCGFSDWRLPTRQELVNIVDYGRVTIPLIDNTWFPNTTSSSYWSVESRGIVNADAWAVSFQTGHSPAHPRSDARSVRLVRGDAPGESRFSYSTVGYGGDGANNLVNDAWTGLQWRRCEQGRVWSGSACTGTASTFTHEEVLALARDQIGWRLPNAKELNSLVDLSVNSGAKIHPKAFPDTSSAFFWTSSPYVRDSDFAWYVDFYNGNVGYDGRYYGVMARVVRASQ